MDTQQKIALANEILGNNAQNKVKILGNDRSLIERTESSKIILTQEGKELLVD